MLFGYDMDDGFVKTQTFHNPVIPAQAGIPSFQHVLDSSLRGNDEKLVECSFEEFIMNTSSLLHWQRN